MSRPASQRLAESFPITRSRPRFTSASRTIPGGGDDGDIAAGRVGPGGVGPGGADFGGTRPGSANPARVSAGRTGPGGADSGGACISSANPAGISPSGACPDSARPEGADFRGTCLGSANPSRVNLGGACLSRASPGGTSPGRADPDGADPDGADLLDAPAGLAVEAALARRCEQRGHRPALGAEPIREPAGAESIRQLEGSRAPVVAEPHRGIDTGDVIGDLRHQRGRVREHRREHPPRIAPLLAVVLDQRPRSAGLRGLDAGRAGALGTVVLAGGQIDRLLDPLPALAPQPVEPALPLPAGIAAGDHAPEHLGHLHVAAQRVAGRQQGVHAPGHVGHEIEADEVEEPEHPRSSGSPRPAPAPHPPCSTPSPAAIASMSAHCSQNTPMRLAMNPGVSLHSTTPLPRRRSAKSRSCSTSSGRVAGPRTISSSRM